MCQARSNERGTSLLKEVARLVAEALAGSIVSAVSTSRVRENTSHMSSIVDEYIFETLASRENGLSSALAV